VPRARVPCRQSRARDAARPSRRHGARRGRGGRAAGARLAGGQRAGRGRGRDGAGPATGRARRGQGRGASRGRRREGEEGERREGEGKTHLRGSKFRRSRLQTLGHHGERERGGRWRGRLLRGRNQMRQMDQGEGGGARMGRAGGAWGARAGPGRAGSGWATSQIETHDTHDH
jgi:hypothetical protein